MSSSARLLRRQRGAQILEFALVLPFLAVLVVGIVEFALGFLLRQRLTNAAREGVRIAIKMPKTDLAEDVPESIQSIKNAITEYLEDAHVDTSTFDADPTETGAGEFTYYDGDGNAVIVIARAVSIPVTGEPAIEATRVTLRYPYSWSFNEIIQLLVPSADYDDTFLISTQAEMKNLL
jgi:Flp pilus assembly protein TadG